MNQIQKALKKFIDEGYLVKERNLHNRGDVWENINGEEYEHWISKTSLFLNTHFGNNFLFDKFMETSRRAPGNGTDHFNSMIGVLKALFEQEKELTGGPKLQPPQQNTTKKFDKIFISHSTKDSEYVKLFVHLLNIIGIQKDNTHIFCSSFPGYDIPEGEKIYDYIKKQFNENILVVFILSDNYYDSVACLNEMGATWVASKEYTSILLPNFSFNKIQGAIDPTVISFTMDDKPRLNEFRKKIINLFNLEDYDANIWDGQRDKFLEDLNRLVRDDMYVTSSLRVEVENVNPIGSDEIEITLRFINKSKMPSQCTELNVSLIDSDNQKMDLNINNDFLDNLVIYKDENRTEKYTVQISQINPGHFNVRRWQAGRTSSHWRSY